jgi:hypothetical protein
MKTVFVLGAGASRQAGAPLMSDFLDKAQDLLRLKTPGINEVSKEFEDVFDALSKLQGVHSKSYLDLDNIEAVFGAIEMGVLLKRLPSRDESSVVKLRNSLVTLIYKTLEYSLPFPVVGKRVDPPAPYGPFVLSLAQLKKNEPSADPYEFSFVTFNYDVCLDYALHQNGIPFNYYLEPAIESSTLTPLLKLHGSINWGRSSENRIVPFEIKEIDFGPFVDEHQHRFLNMGSSLDTKMVDDKPLEGPPLIVPPTWNKNSYHGQLSNVWAKAAQEFADAENICVIGYSLPETDSFFRYLYALGSESEKRIRNFVVINPDSSGEVEGRFRQLIGRGIEKRFRYYPLTFADGLRPMMDMLTNP